MKKAFLLFCLFYANSIFAQSTFTYWAQNVIRHTQNFTFHYGVEEVSFIFYVEKELFLGVPEGWNEWLLRVLPCTTMKMHEEDLDIDFSHLQKVTSTLMFAPKDNGGFELYKTIELTKCEENDVVTFEQKDS